MRRIYSLFINRAGRDSLGWVVDKLTVLSHESSHSCGGSGILLETHFILICMN